MSTSIKKEIEIQVVTPLDVFKPYIAYLVMFLGTGLISGSIVHVAQEENRIYAVVLMGVGAVLFALGSIMNELLFKTGLLGDTPVRYVLLSLLLAIGIGMISGSTQHFFDTPIYASYLAPLGVFLSLLAFAIRQGYVLHKKNWIGMILAGCVFAIVFHLGLNAYAKTLPQTQGHHSSPEAILHTEKDDHVSDQHVEHSGVPVPLALPSTSVGTVMEKIHKDGHTDADHKNQ